MPEIADGIEFFDAAVRLLRKGLPPMPPLIPRYSSYIRYGSVYWHCVGGPLVLRWVEKIRERRDWYGYAEPLLAFFFPGHPFRRPEWRPPDGITEGENPSNAIGWPAKALVLEWKRAARRREPLWHPVHYAVYYRFFDNRVPEWNCYYLFLAIFLRRELASIQAAYPDRWLLLDGPVPIDSLSPAPLFHLPPGLRASWQDWIRAVKPVARPYHYKRHKCLFV
jgi:hypothetical protein